MTRVQDALLREIALDAGRRIVDRAVGHLRSMGAQLSGDDAGLKNVWEEFCVQVQGEESFFWDEYIQTVEDVLAGALKGARPLESTAIWLQTDEGRDWLSENDQGNAAPPVSDEDSVKWLYALAWGRADANRHVRVVAYLARRLWD
jgi:hypothetical protein